MLGIFNSSVPNNKLRTLTGSCHFTTSETLEPLSLKNSWFKAETRKEWGWLFSEQEK